MLLPLRSLVRQLPPPPLPLLPLGCLVRRSALALEDWRLDLVAVASPFRRHAAEEEAAKDVELQDVAPPLARLSRVPVQLSLRLVCRG